MGPEIRAREAAQKPVREADRAEAHGLVDPHGGQWRTRAALADNRSMPRRRPGLARGGVQSLQQARKPAAGCHPPAARHTYLEAGSLAEMPVLSETSLGAAGTDEPADRGARGHR